MKKNVMAKNLRQSIKKSLGRYIAIVAIIALGAGMFVGLRTTKSDMIATGQKYMDEQNMFDLRLLNTYGWDRSHVEKIAQMDGVVDAEGVMTVDVIARMQGAEDDTVLKLYSIPENINLVALQGGRMPQGSGECLADGFHTTDEILGTTITISDTNTEDTLDILTTRTLTVVGYVSSPLYMDMSRGNTSLGSGTISAFVYVPQETFDADYYPEIYVTVEGDYAVYSDEYHGDMESWGDRLADELTPLATDRYLTIRGEAEQAYNDGVQEYENGVAEYEEGRLQAETELADARKQLEDGQKELDDNRKLLEDGLKELELAQEEIDKNLEMLTQSKVTLAQSKAQVFTQLAQANAALMANYKTVNENLSLVEDGIAQIDDGISQIDSGISQLESGLSQLDMMISITQTMISVMDTSINTMQSALDAAKESGAEESVVAQMEAQLQELKDRRESYVLQLQEMQENLETYSAQLEQLRLQRQELEAQRAELVQTQRTLENALEEIDAGFLELQNSQLQAENEFAAAEAQIEAGELQLELAQKELDSGRKEIEDGLKALEEAQTELDDGWEAYYSGEAEVLAELADAETALLEAEQTLQDARQQLDDMDEPEVYALSRTTNVGYLALDNNSDIVEGVSTVFPAFFLLIAALVCITTMTRMVEEERTQIGTLKALGYGEWAIIGKYLTYAGSAAIIGCGLGVIVGSIVFPLILWEAYGIILNLASDIVLQIDWGLCLLVVGMYTAVTLFVTWYCCRKALQEVPAELIRPKAPTAGKKIFLEYLPFWDKFSFLNKVMLRNVFRYRQRLLMMLVGIGGCTALLLTGFGLRDSIVDIVSYQFQEVMLYDLEVRFTEEVDAQQQEEFRQALSQDAENICFYHQSSAEVDFGDQTKEINMIVAESEIAEFIRFQDGDRMLSMPGTGETLITIGTAEAMGITVGDTIIVRDADMRSMTLTVSGIYDNNVYNYIVITPQTAMLQWGEVPEVQMACVTVKEGVDPSVVSAGVTEMNHVMSVSVSQELADMVGSMLEALDLVVITVVICAGLLAVIVLYNLTNINITERIREIATIKVLGFRSGETAAYVFKENLLLSAMGTVVGLGGGILLLKFVMSKIRIDMVWLPARLNFPSYIWAVVLTMLAACLVDFLLYFKLEKINMAEALKSVE